MKQSVDSSEELLDTPDDFQASNLEINSNTPNQRPYYSLVIFFGVIVIVSLGIFVVWKVYGFSALTYLFNLIQKTVEERSIWSYLFYFGMICCFSWLIIPGGSYFFMALSFFMKNFLEPFSIIFLGMINPKYLKGTYLASLACFAVVRSSFRERMERKYRDNKIFKVIKIEVEKSPWKFMLIVNLIVMPMAIKNTILPLTKVKFHQFAICSLPFYMFFTALFVNIGLSAHSVSEIVRNKSKWSEMAISEKVAMVSTWVIVITTLVLLCVLGKWVRDKVLELRDEDGEEEEAMV